MDYTIEPRLQQLNNSIKETESKLLESIQRHESAVNEAVIAIKSDVNKTLKDHISEFKNFNTSVANKYLEFDSKCKEIFACQKRFELDVREHLDAQDRQQNQRDSQLYNTINALTNRMERIHFDIIDNEDNLAVTYMNSNGKIEYGAIKKVFADNSTIVMSDKNVLSWNYSFDENDFDINSEHKISIKPCNYLTTTTGKKLSIDRLNNDLENATYNINTLNQKFDFIVKKLSSFNGYVASNNFLEEIPSQESLTEFAISCLSTTSEEITKDLIPNGTRIKNTYNNHIWVFNRFNSSGLTQTKWEDFGSDTICIANNSGIHGLVTGSQERLKGHVDVTGVISVNGLEEELSSILEALLTLSNDVKDLNARFIDLEQRNN